MRCAGQTAHGLRVRALIVVLWRAALAESDLDRTTGRDSRVTGKGRREVGMDRWGWQQIEPWLDFRPACRSARCCASCTDQPPVGRGRRRPRVARCAALP
jgi:hypothetical protein